MAQSVLGSLTLGYQALWSRARLLAGVQLFVHEDEAGTDGQHLLRTIGELWSARSPLLVLSIRSRELLTSALNCAKPGNPHLDVPLAWLSTPELRAAARIAHGRGARLIASGPPRHRPDAETAAWFERRAVSLSAADAAEALRIALRPRGGSAQPLHRAKGGASDSPVPPGALVEGVASRALAEHALDQQGAWCVAGWPAEEVLQRHRGRPMPPSRRALMQALNAVSAEQSLDRIEQAFAQEPALAYRLLLYLNSAGLGLRSGVASLRHGFMMLGFSKLAAWLAGQLPQASEDANLHPVNAGMALRGQLMQQLMDAGIEDDLRREIHLCGLFSQLDLVQDEPLKTSLARLPLSERLNSALLAGSGPYAPVLHLARALEGEEPAPRRALRRTFEFAPEELNRALLRTLAALPHG